jgi:acyl transferase domain-containing protein
MTSGEGTTDRRQLLEQALRRLRRTKAELAKRDDAVAIIGAGVRAPLGLDDLDALWAALSRGVDAVSPLADGTDGRRPSAGTTGRLAGQLSCVDGFDAEFFGIPDAEAAYLDPQQRLVLETAWEAVEDAGLPVDRLREASTGVFLGLYGNDYLALQLTGHAEITAYTAPGAAHSVAANRLSYLLDLSGPSVAVDSACSSSLVAVHMAVRALRAGDCDYALVGGVNLILASSSSEMTEKVLPMAADGHCRTFDARADGIVRAEGCGMVLLTRMSDAREGKLPVRAVIRGTAVNHNGRTNGLTAPSPVAQQRLLRKALADAGVDAREVGYIEAHGTGTRLGDPIEVEALRAVYGPGERTCALGSVKTNFGHQEAAAGIVGLLKAMLVLEHRQVPPHPHLGELNPEISLDGTRLTIPTELTDLRGGMAAVSSFGFGGANAHVVLAAGFDPPVAVRRPSTRLVLPLSARGHAALAALARRYADVITADNAADVCATAALGRTHHAHRLCVSANDADALVAQLRTVRRASTVSRGQLGFVFSGQGSQWTAMGKELLRLPAAHAEIEACDRHVREAAGWSVIEQLTAAADRLAETTIAQVSIGVLQFALVAQLWAWGVRPHAVAGHSMGEIIACAVAGMLDRDRALELLLWRAELTERGARGGAMLSVPLPVAAVRALLTGIDGRIGIGAVNGPRSTVVSGERDAVAAVERRVGGRRLRVDYAFHSPLLDEVTRGASPQPPITGGHADFYSTVTGGRAEPRELDATHWRRNLRDHVDFMPAVEAMLRDGVTTLVEIGPHPVLLKNILEIADHVRIPVDAVGTLSRDQRALPALHGTLAALYEAGQDVDWAEITGRPSCRQRLPAYPWQRGRHWLTQSDLPLPTTAPAVEHSRELTERLVDYICQRLADTWGLAPGESVGAEHPLDGIDSLVLVELKNQIEREFALVVPLRALLAAETPMALAAGVADGAARRRARS